MLGLGVAGVVTVASFGHGTAPSPVARIWGIDLGSLSPGPAPVDHRVNHPPRHGKPGAKPGVKKPGAKPGAKNRHHKPGPRTAPRRGGNALPGVGRRCTRVQANVIRSTPRGPVVCAQMGSGDHRWISISGVDPQVRKLGGKCSGQYTTARGARGRAMQCARGHWTYNG